MVALGGWHPLPFSWSPGRQPVLLSLRPRGLHFHPLCAVQVPGLKLQTHHTPSRLDAYWPWSEAPRHLAKERSCVLLRSERGDSANVRASIPDWRPECPAHPVRLLGHVGVWKALIAPRLAVPPHPHLHSTPRPSRMLGFPENGVTPSPLNRVTRYSPRLRLLGQSSFSFSLKLLVPVPSLRHQPVSRSAFARESPGGAGR